MKLDSFTVMLLLRGSCPHSCCVYLMSKSIKPRYLSMGRNKDAKPVCDATKRQFKQRAEKLSRECHLGKVKPAESHRTDGIMVADMLAGAAQRAVEGGTPDYLASLRRQITVVRSP